MDLARRDVAAILKQAQLDIDTAFLQAQLSNSTEATAPPPAIPPNAAAIQEAEEGQTRRDGHDGRDLSFEELVDSHKKLYQTLSQLQVEHRELQARYQSERDDWNKFRGWWHSVVAKKRASHGESTRMVGSEKTGIASSSSKGGSNVEAMSKKRKLSQGEQALFHRLGMECDATPMNATGQTPFSPRQSTSSGSEGEEKVFSRSESKRKEEEETIDQQRPCTASAIGGEASRNARSEDDDRALRKSARANSQDDIRDIANVKASEEEGRAEAQDLEFVQKEKHNTDRLRRMQELLANPLKYKGRGRYSNGTKEHTEGVEVDKERTPISKEYEIDPERNGGVDFLHKVSGQALFPLFGLQIRIAEIRAKRQQAVVRDKAQRKGMHAFDCECCREVSA